MPFLDHIQQTPKSLEVEREELGLRQRSGTIVAEILYPRLNVERHIQFGNVHRCGGHTLPIGWPRLAA
jgi:hypothetical protein